jgi:hypothetical protein
LPEQEMTDHEQTKAPFGARTKIFSGRWPGRKRRLKYSHSEQEYDHSGRALDYGSARRDTLITV